MFLTADYADKSDSEHFIFVSDISVIRG